MKNFFSRFDINKKPILLYHKDHNYIKNCFFGFVFSMMVTIFFLYYIVLKIINTYLGEYTFSYSSCDEGCLMNLQKQPFFDLSNYSLSDDINFIIYLKSYQDEQSMTDFFKYFRFVYSFPRNNIINKYILNFKCNETDINLPDVDLPNTFPIKGSYCSAIFPINSIYLNFYLNESQNLLQDVNFGFESCSSLKYKNNISNFDENKVTYTKFEPIYNNENMEGCNYNTKELFNIKNTNNRSISEDLFQMYFALPGEYRIYYYYNLFEQERGLYGSENKYRLNFKLSNDNKQTKYYIRNIRQKIDYEDRFFSNQNSFYINYFEDNIYNMYQDINFEQEQFFGPLLKIYLFYKSHNSRIILDDNTNLIDNLSKIGGLLSMYKSLSIMFNFIYPFYKRKIYGEAIINANQRFSHDIIENNSTINKNIDDEISYRNQRNSSSCNINLINKQNDLYLNKGINTTLINNKSKYSEPIINKFENFEYLLDEINNYIYKYSLVEYIKDLIFCRFKERKFVKEIRDKFTLEYYFYIILKIKQHEQIFRNNNF